MKCKIRAPGIPRLVARSTRDKPARAVMSGAPPVEDTLRETAVGPTSSSTDSSSSGRLACSLQSLRGKLSRASVRSSGGGDTSSSSITRAVPPTSTRPPRATSHVDTVKQSQPPAAAAASSPTKSAATTTGAANGGGPTAPLARAESANSVVGDGASAGAPPATGGAPHGVSSAPVAARGGVGSEGRGSGGACGVGESQSGGRNSGGVETQSDTRGKGGGTGTKDGGVDGTSGKTGGSGGAQSTLSAESDSKSSADPPPDKPHVCGSFFSPCCAKRAGSGVTTFSSRTSAASSSGCSSLGSLSITGKYSTKSSGDSGPSSLNSSLKSSTGSASSGVASRGSNISSNETGISGVEGAKSPTGGTPSGAERNTSRYKTVGSAEGSLPPTSRHRSPVSLARILARPVFASPISEATSGSPPSRPTAPARKKSSSVVYFHPEFHPQVIEEGDQGSNTQRSQMPSRSMGNSSSSSLASPTPRSPTFRPRVTLPPDYEYMKKLVPELKMEIKDKDHRIAQLEVELNEARRSVQKKDNEISKLHREIHKMQSVLAASPALSNGDLAGKLHGAHLTAPHTKKQGVSGESSQVDVSNLSGTAPKFDKDFRSKQLIKEAIMDNDFLKKLDSSQLREIVESMYPKQYAKGTHLIREGEVGSHLFVSAEGQMEVIKDGQVLGQMGPGKAFGELAILYNCTRTASVKAVTAVQVWELERRVFQAVMMRTAIRRLEDNLSFLRSVPLLAKLSREKLVKMADVIETEHFTPGSYIIREGTSGDTFYIISAGSVKVTQRASGGEEDEIRTLKAGEFFGEQALLREDKRTANIIALPPSVTVLALDRTSFQRLIGDLQELRDLKYEERPASRTNSTQRGRTPNEFSHLTLDSLDIIATLGIGGFGRVELVQNVNSRGQTLALKCLKKHYIVETQQQEHVHSEKEIMLMCNHQFIVRLYKTFRDTKYVYLLMDACLGGEVWSILRDRGQFDTDTCRFYTACVVEALEYLHKRNIVYRDLKPENLLLDTEGFCKLTDFGFSKELRNHGKTWTFCGTPEYVSPEVILNKGHDRAVDYWSLGVLMFELYTGAPPFTASDPMKTYNIILKGIEIIDFPRHIPRAGEQLIKRLCRDIPTERLGYQRNGVDDIRKHKWFQGFDWEGLRARALAPPIVPQVKGPTDASNFDCYTRDLETPPDELSGWDEDF